MSIRLIGLAVLALAAAPVSAWAQAGDVSAGKAYWTGNTAFCQRCHGANGEGGFGPDLAGRALTVEQFTHAVRQPWGVMPAFTAEQISDRQVLDLMAFFGSLPRVTQPAPWRTPLEASMPIRQQLSTSHGCTQCHGAEFAGLRQAMGGVQADYAFFTRLVYNHTTSMPEFNKLLGDNAPMRMGNFSNLRLPESVLQEIWKFINEDLGYRALVQARMAPGTPATGGTQYAVTVVNAGLANKGPAAEDMTVSVTLPAGASVVTTTGAGYQGTRKDEKGLDVASWKVARLAPTDKQIFTVTLSGTAPAQAGTVSWVKPALKKGAPNDTINVAMPPRPAAQ